MTSYFSTAPAIVARLSFAPNPTTGDTIMLTFNAGTPAPGTYIYGMVPDHDSFKKAFVQSQVVAA